ncbi:hypothetical protein HanHA300_Chr00c0016g0682701 [Helianthus annuus]|nr:hypothetical protein HanLR1_Chr17g0660691 [Helianthus annuus]KAJ0638939.1 hypothetical protein HanHA300_Chr00c0016g0682701 [Helianthus annuus]
MWTGMQFTQQESLKDIIASLFLCLKSIYTCIKPFPASHFFHPAPLSEPQTVMAKFFAILLLALLVISMLQATVLAKGGHHHHGYGPGSLKSSRG